MHAEAGLERHLGRLLDEVRKDEPPRCIKEAAAGTDLVLSGNTAYSCPECPLNDIGSGKFCLTAPLIHDSRRFGFLTVLLSGRMNLFEEEKNLIREVSRDIAYALYNLEIETKRCEALSALAESERKMSTLMANLPGMAYRCQNVPERTMEFVSDGCRALTGYDPEDVALNKTVCYADLIHKHDRDKIRWTVRQSIEEGQSFEIEYRVVTKQGTERWVWEKGSAVSADDTQPVTLEGFVWDITDRKEAEKAFAESEAQYRDLFDSIRDAILVTDTERHITNCNRAFTNLFGYTLNELRGRKTHSVYDDMNEFEQMGEEIKQKIGSPGFLYTIHYRKKSGEVFPGETGVFYLKDRENNFKGVIGLIRDITERVEHEEEKKQLENKLNQAQKMESIGTLAGGIAHDFNNILSAILGYSQLALSYVSPESDEHNDLQEIHKAGLRASDLIRQILTFSRKSETRFMPVKTAPIIKETVKLLKSTIPSYIEITSSIENPKLKIMHDPTKLHQILMNLCINASHAMEENGGVLTVEVKEEGVSESFVKNFAGLEAGDHLKIRISDTGTGIPAEIIDSIFDPYFTTKDPKEGTGLGLSVVHGLVKEGKGDIQVDSVPGEGTTFTIYFPAVQKEEKAVKEDRPAGSVQGDEAVLFVDDEPSVAKLGARLLGQYGYRVTTETDSLKALERVRQDPFAFDLVITDMTMPNLTGDMLLEKILKINPDLPVILATGYTKRMAPEQAIERGFKDVIKKPFSQTDFAGSVRAILDKR